MAAPRTPLAATALFRRERAPTSTFSRARLDRRAECISPRLDAWVLAIACGRSARGRAARLGCYVRRRRIRPPRRRAPARFSPWGRALRRPSCVGWRNNYSLRGLMPFDGRGFTARRVHIDPWPSFTRRCACSRTRAFARASAMGRVLAERQGCLENTASVHTMSAVAWVVASQQSCRAGVVAPLRPRLRSNERRKLGSRSRRVRCDACRCQRRGPQ